jgi:hypothetical protein
MQKKGLVLDSVPIDEIYDGKGRYPCVLYTRTQEGGKTRNVWGYPISDTLAEARFHQIFMGVERDFDYRAALKGPDAVDSAISDLFAIRAHMIGKGEKMSIHCVDFSAFDASISPELSAQAFSFIGNYFQEGVRHDILDIYQRFCTIPIITPDGVYSGVHGVPSGSRWTNTVDSIVQVLVSQWEYADCQVQGDDGVYLLDEWDEASFYDKFEVAGLKINRDKSHVFRDESEAIYLQRYYHERYRNRKGRLGGVYPISRALNRLKYLERWTDFEREGITGEDFYSLRAIMILENCKHHPYFEELVKYVHRLDRGNLSFSNQGIHAFSRMLESKARAGVLSSTVPVKEGIMDFEVIKLIKSF